MLDLNKDGIDDLKQPWLYEKIGGFILAFLLWHAEKYPNTDLAKFTRAGQEYLAKLGK